MNQAALISPLLLLGCAEAPATDSGVFAPEYRGVETRLLDSDLVQIQVAMTGARDRRDVTAYADCAAAQYTLIRGYGFARHLRTNFEEKGGVSAADAVYTISPSLPRGLKTIDAEVAVAACKENGIPTV
ncbi:hypothetical protein [Seohaeicola zhoushanensis]|uniref:Lipoprotein n=1 Tax=Seohaeicola zhoushanensis TaxID=1569283 RepID=A0A8J3GWX0_9RHOB|nr:hypothetical protein [Seohaeicola zhoushanensis]GHF47330.1 hypothetical protein GCM10017056_18860 [Seohaeicola zhoushanensis]